MDRRALLALIGSSVAGFAGCASTVETTPTDTPTATADGTAIDVELQEVPVVGSAHPRRRFIEQDEIVPVTEVPQPLRDALREAHDTPTFVRLDGTVYGIGAGKPDHETVPVSVTVEEGDGGDRRFEVTVSPAPAKVDRELDDAFTFTSQGALPSVLWISP